MICDSTVRLFCSLPTSVKFDDHSACSFILITIVVAVYIVVVVVMVVVIAMMMRSYCDHCHRISSCFIAHITFKQNNFVNQHLCYLNSVA